MNTIERDNTYVAHAYGRFPISIVDGHGSILVDENGKEYIDFGSGIGVNIFGVNDEVWKMAVKDQIEKVQHTSNLYILSLVLSLPSCFAKKPE